MPIRTLSVMAIAALTWAAADSALAANRYRCAVDKTGADQQQVSVQLMLNASGAIQSDSQIVWQPTGLPKGLVPGLSLIYGVKDLQSGGVGGLEGVIPLAVAPVDPFPTAKVAVIAIQVDDKVAALPWRLYGQQIPQIAAMLHDGSGRKPVAVVGTVPFFRGDAPVNAMLDAAAGEAATSARITAIGDDHTTLFSTSIPLTARAARDVLAAQAFADAKAMTADFQTRCKDADAKPAS